MVEPPGTCMRVALSALTQMAEWFRDEQGRRMLFIDNIFGSPRLFGSSGNDVLAADAVGRGIPAHAGRRDGRAAAHHLDAGEMMQAVYVPADDYTDPAPATTFAHLDATTELSRGVLQGHLPKAVGPAVQP